MPEIKSLSTFSIAAFEPETGALGVAVQSKFLAAGSIVPHIETGVGAVATQALANPQYGPRGLELLRQGKSPQEVIDALTSADKDASHRQVGIVDHRGRAATYTGEQCMDWAGGLTGTNFAAQGNILANEETVLAMGRTFQEEKGPLADRLIKALGAAQKAGGDKRGQQSAALLVFKKDGGYGGLWDRYIDLRVDDHPKPIEKLAEMLDLFYLYFSRQEGKQLPLEGDILLQVQKGLQTMGLYRGDLNGRLTSDTRKALETFYYMDNFEDRIPQEDVIPEDIFTYLQKRIKGISE